MQAVNQATLRLQGIDRVRYFAPVGFCVFLCALCLGLAVVSTMVRIPEALAITAVALLGVFACAVAGALLLRLQLHWLRYTHLAVRQSPQAAWEAVHQTALDSGWSITHEIPGHTLRATTPGTMFGEGERVAVEFSPHEVLVASICDPAVGFSLTGHERCRQHSERVRRAVQGV